jgi:hypothetical protein
MFVQGRHFFYTWVFRIGGWADAFADKNVGERLKVVKDHDVVVVWVRLSFHNEVIIGLFNKRQMVLEVWESVFLELLAFLVDKNPSVLEQVDHLSLNRFF